MRLHAMISIALFVCSCAESASIPTSDAGVDGDAGLQFVAHAIENLPDPSINFFSVWGSGATDVFLAGERGTVVHYDGVAWRVQTTPTIADLHSVWGRSTIAGAPADDVYAVGDDGVVVHYDGTAWSMETSTTTVDLHAVSGRAGASPRVWAAGVDGVMATKDLSDPEAVWVLEDSSTLEGINGLWFDGDQRGVAVGNLGVILRHDGARWARQRIAGLTVPLQGVWGTAYNRLWIAGLDGTLLRSQGDNFAEVEGAPRVFLRKIAGQAFDEVYFTGWGGILGRATPAGAERIDSVSNYRLEGIWSTSIEGVAEPRIYVVGVSGTVLIGGSITE